MGEKTMHTIGIDEVHGVGTAHLLGDPGALQNAVCGGSQKATAGPSRSWHGSPKKAGELITQRWGKKLAYAVPSNEECSAKKDGLGCTDTFVRIWRSNPGRNDHTGEVFQRVRVRTRLGD